METDIAKWKCVHCSASLYYAMNEDDEKTLIAKHMKTHESPMVLDESKLREEYKNWSDNQLRGSDDAECDYWLEILRSHTEKAYQAGRESSLNELKLHLEKQLSFYDTVNKYSLFKYIDDAIKEFLPHAK